MRAETGPMQIGDDWPGVFIRGDNAMAYAMQLEAVLAGHFDPINRGVLQGLVSTLRGCDVRKRPDVQMAELTQKESDG